MDTKFGKLISRDREGTLTEVYPEILVDDEVNFIDRKSRHPVTNIGVANAIDDAINTTKDKIKEAFTSSSGGLGWDESIQKGYVDFSQMPKEDIQNIASSIVDPSGAIIVDEETGRIKVDFSQLPSTIIDEIAESVVNKINQMNNSSSDVYVSAMTGDDANDGLTPQTPKRTIAAAEAIYASDPYSAPKEVTVHIGSGPYSEKIKGSDFINFIYDAEEGTTLRTNNPIQISGRKIVCLTGSFYIDSGLTDPIVVQDCGALYLGAPGKNLSVNFVTAAPPTGIYPVTAILHASQYGIIRPHSLATSVSIRFSAVNFNTALLYAHDFSTINLGPTSECPVALSMHDDVTGKKYKAENNSYIITNGSGEDFIPGSEPGEIDSSSHYV